MRYCGSDAASNLKNNYQSINQFIIQSAKSPWYMVSVHFTIKSSTITDNSKTQEENELVTQVFKQM